MSNQPFNDTAREDRMAAVAAEAVARESRWRCAGRPLWFLLPASLGRWRAAVAGSAAAVLVVLLYLALTISLHGATDAWLLLSEAKVAATASFFVASLGLLAGLAQIVFPAAREDLEALADTRRGPPRHIESMSDALLRLPRRSALGALPVALTFAAIHIWLLGPSSPDLGPELAGNICNVLLWVAMFQISVPLVHNARLFSLLGRYIEVDLYRPSELTPFGRTAIRPCLFLIALQCAYVLLVLPDGTRFSAGTAIGLMASMVLVAALFFLPLGGIRSRIRSRRSAALAALDAQLARLPQPDQALSGHGSLVEASGLMDLRARMESVSSWPLGLAGVRRLFVYLILVPLTWVGAALAEMLVEAGL